MINFSHDQEITLLKAWKEGKWDLDSLSKSIGCSTSDLHLWSSQLTNNCIKPECQARLPLTAYETLTDGCLIFKSDKTLHYSNPAYREHQNLSPSKGQSINELGLYDEIILFIHENIHDECPTRSLVLEKPFGPWNEITSCRLADPYLTILFSHDTKNNEKYSSLKRSQQFYSDIIQLSVDWVWEVNAEGIYTYVDGHHKNILGYERHEILGKSPFDFMPKEEVSSIKSSYESILKKKDNIVNLKNWNLRKDGKKVLLLTNGVPIFDTEGNFTGYRGIDRDITEEYHQQIKLDKERKKALKESHAKSNFLANMSHELRTPMNGILGLLDVILDTDLPHETKENLKNVLNSSEQLLTILNDILDISKIEAGKMTLSNETFDLVACLESVRKLFLPKANHKGLLLDCNISLGEAFWVEADQGKIKQILTNLISNSIKFTEEGNVTISAEKSDDDSVILKIEDTGIGISKQATSKVFDKFFQEKESKSNQVGTGLGLSIVKKLVTLLKGKISVESNYGEGTTFTLNLPLSVKQTPQVDVDKPTQSIDLKGKILVVDDLSINRLMLTKLLLKMNLEVVSVSSGEEAIQTVDEENFSLILMDCMMPDMDGYEASRRILSKHPNLPIIAQTANASQDDIQKSLQSGMVDHITKPIRKNHLSKVLSKYLES